MSAGDYARVIRPLLPGDAFLPGRDRLWRMAVHFALVGTCWWIIRTSGHPLVWALAAVVLGHSQICLAFIAHDTSHGAVVRSRPLRRVLELLLWGQMAVPPTLWRRIHNKTHHLETNTVHDTDRSFRRSERTWATWVYTRLFFPNRQTPLRHPIWTAHFLTYFLRHAITGLLPGRVKLPIVTHKPAFTTREKMCIVAEIALIGGFYYGLWCFVGRDAWRFLWAVPVPLLVDSTVGMLYIFTNHFLNPLCERTDPLLGSTSVIVPRWMDWLHDNFSYHTEHHVFPGMSPRWYPEVSKLLQEHFPDRYNRLPLAEAWRRLWQKDEFISEE